MTEVNGNAIRPRYDFTREECGLYQSPAKSPVGSQTTGLRTRFRSETWPNRRVSRMLVERRPKRPRFERTLPFASRRRESRWYPPTLGKLKRRGVGGSGANIREDGETVVEPRRTMVQLWQRSGWNPLRIRTSLPDRSGHGTIPLDSAKFLPD